MAIFDDVLSPESVAEGGAKPFGGFDLPFGKTSEQLASAQAPPFFPRYKKETRGN